MITYFDFPPFVVGFALTGLKIDWLQFAYDLLMLAASSYIVYKITHGRARRRGVRAS